MHKVDCVLVRDNGVLLVEETLAGLRTRLEEIAANENGNLDEIANAVAAVWADLPAMKTIQLGVLSSYALNKMNIPVAEYETIQERVKQYIRTATDLFAIVRGPSGGVANLSRCTEEELAKIAGQRAKEAAKKAAKVA